MSPAFASSGAEQTRAIAAEFCRALPPGSVVALHGDLGAGKTCFVKGMAEALGIDPARVTSPTYTLLHEYEGDRLLVHADLYRLENENDAVRIGLDEAIDSDAITVIEWPSRAAGLLPPRTRHVTLTPGASPDERLIEITEPSS